MTHEGGWGEVVRTVAEGMTSEHVGDGRFTGRRWPLVDEGDGIRIVGKEQRRARCQANINGRPKPGKVLLHGGPNARNIRTVHRLGHAGWGGGVIRPRSL